MKYDSWSWSDIVAGPATLHTYIVSHHWLNHLMAFIHFLSSDEWFITIEIILDYCCTLSFAWENLILITICGYCCNILFSHYLLFMLFLELSIRSSLLGFFAFLIYVSQGMKMYREFRKHLCKLILSIVELNGTIKRIFYFIY